MEWEGAVPVAVGGGLIIAGLMGWHISHDNLLGFALALGSAFGTWAAGNAWVVNNRPVYGMFATLSAMAAVISFATIF